MKKVSINNLPDWEDFKKELLRDPEVKREYDALEDEFRLARELIKARLERHLTQEQLAQKIGVKQEAIARLESGQANPRYKTLTRVAKALDKKVAFVEK